MEISFFARALRQNRTSQFLYGVTDPGNEHVGHDFLMHLAGYDSAHRPSDD